MEHVAKWTVVVVTVLAMLTVIVAAVARATEAATAGRNRDEAAGVLLIGVLCYLVILVSVLVWWQPE
jgi:uncharacterized membrane protein